MSLPIIVRVFCLAIAMAVTAAAAPGPTEHLQLVSVRDHIEGSFTTPAAVYADAGFIYLASNQGKLFILKRSKAENFPLVQTVNIGSPLTGVRGFASRLYVTSADGYLREY